MLRQELSAKFDRLLNIIVVINGVLITMMTATLKTDLDNYRALPFVYSALTQSRLNAWWLVPVLMLATFITQQVKTQIGAKNSWKVVQTILDGYRDDLFGKTTSSDPQHFHRVTLFKHVKFRFRLCRWPWSHWLIPVARSGSTTKSKIPAFRASRNDPTRAQGIVGRTWVEVRSIRIEGSPLLNDGDSVGKEQAVEDYATQSLVTKEWVLAQIKKKRQVPLARSLFGMIVESKGKDWGVLVVDSCNPQAIELEKKATSSPYKILANVLKNVLADL